jgi:multiple antibiotic resistance protein
MELTPKDILTVSMILFAVIDILGAVPIIIDLKQKGNTIHPIKTTLVSLVIMITFLFLGESILGLIGIDISSFAIAGALVIFFIALEMTLGIKLNKQEITGTVSIVPIAFPFIAGPGIMTALLSLRAQYNVETIIIGIVLNLGVVYIVLRTTHHLERLLGKGGIAVFQKVFGIILMAIAIKLFRTNLKF